MSGLAVARSGSRNPRSVLLMQSEHEGWAGAPGSALLDQISSKSSGSRGRNAALPQIPHNPWLNFRSPIKFRSFNQNQNKKSPKALLLFWMVFLSMLWMKPRRFIHGLARRHRHHGREHGGKLASPASNSRALLGACLAPGYPSKTSRAPTWILSLSCPQGSGGLQHVPERRGGLLGGCKLPRGAGGASSG